MASRVKVVVRVRPLLEFEAGHGCEVLDMEPEGRGGLLVMRRGAPHGDKEFQVDAVFPPATKQDELFDGCNLGSMVRACLKGYHATVFAYGQTGSGKTFTMEGYDYEDTRPSRNSKGILEQRSRPKPHLHPSQLHKLGLMPRAIDALFTAIAAKAESSDRQYRVRVTYTQIYNEKVYDLLNPVHLKGGSAGKAHPGLRVRWTKHDGFYVENVFSHEVASAAEAMAFMHAGITRKVMAAHSMNAASSRSHCLFRLHVDSFDAATPEVVVSSRLTLVDLAGSERVARTHATGATLKESIGINQSLFVLRNVITALTAPASGAPPHVPYRDSKLTSLLKQSLGGNSLTLMVACVAPSDAYTEENLSTLEYARLASQIANTPTVNEDPRTRIIRELKKEVGMLRQELAAAHDTIARLKAGGVRASAPPVPVPTAADDSLARALRASLDKSQARVEELEADNTGLSLENQRLREKVEILEYLLADREEDKPPVSATRAGMAPPLPATRRPPSEESTGSGDGIGAAPLRLMTTTGRLLHRLPSFGSGLPGAPKDGGDAGLSGIAELFRARAGLKREFQDSL